MVLKSSPVISMHILMRRSFDVVDVPGAGVADHLAVARLGEQRALPEGLRQRLEAERGEEALAVAHHLPARRSSCAFRISVRSKPGRRPAARPAVDVVPLLRPHVAEQVRGDRARSPGPRRRTSRAASAHVGVQRVVERLDLLPQPVDLLRRRRRAACRTSSATSRRCRRSPARARPCWRARRSARSRLRIGGAIVCQPAQTSQQLAWRRGSSAMIRVISSMSRQLGPARAGQYLPLPYVPSIAATMRVSSSPPSGSEGAASVSASFSSFSLRADVLGQLQPVEARRLLGELDAGGDRAARWPARRGSRCRR